MLKAVENKRLEDMHEIEMLKQKEERLIREKEKLRAHGIQTDADKQRQRELELQIKACDDRIAQDERQLSAIHIAINPIIDLLVFIY